MVIAEPPPSITQVMLPRAPVEDASMVPTPVPSPEIPVDTGRPVQLVRVPEAGVPSTGVTRVGDVANTREPLPVSSVTADIRFALDGVARKVATPVPRPLTPVEIGRPVQLVRVPLVGVPRRGVTSVGLVANTNDPVPVSSVTAVIRFALEGVARKVATPAARPEMPVLTGRPVQLVSVPEVGVPRIGVTSVGEVANTLAPVPVSSVISAMRFALEGVARKVAAPAARPLTPVLIGRQVQLVSVPEVGVPRIGVTNVGLVANTRAPLPVSSVIAVIRLALEGVAKKVATPAASPLMPVDTGRPVQLVRVPLAGVPSVGVVITGLVNVLFVNVSVVARPTRVSVDVGSVSVPVFDIVDMMGAVRVLFVRVCVAVRVTSVSEILGTVSVRAVAVVIPLSSN